MKCLCGYSHLQEWGISRDSGFGKDPELKAALTAANGKEPFIRLIGTFGESGTIVALYACPKCGTVRLGDD